MARCPTCESEIAHVSAQKIELHGTEIIDEELGDGGQAVATVCPECDAILGI